MSAKSLLRACWLLLSIAVLAGCGGAPKPIMLKVGVDAHPNSNPDGRKRPSPVVVRVFELKSITAFNGADYFSLYDKETETLGADLVTREEFRMKPGDKQSLERPLQPDTKYVAALAAFRSLENAQWRSAVAVVRKKKMKELVPIVTVDGNTVTVSLQQ